MLGREVGRMVGGLVAELGDIGERALGNQVNLAVTGLRRSGKTVFITALVHHLIDGHGLPFFAPVHEDRYLGAKLLPVSGAQRFPFEAFHKALSSPTPHWPAATESLSHLRLGLRYRSRHPLYRHLRPIGDATLEIIDYPGEWLLDLPLLDADFAHFTEEAFELAGRAPRAAIAGEWVELARGMAAAKASEEAIGRLADAYTRYLLRVQRELHLSLVQPGRFTNPGELAGSELLRFAPLPRPTPAPGADSLYAAMAARFERYRDQVVRQFYHDHFRRFDRQIVLVDLLSSLNAGPEHFADTQAALAQITGSFRYGQSRWLQRVLAPRIDKVLFAASKADHVAPSQHAALKQLLEILTGPAARGARLEGLRPDVLALASLRCTDVVKTQHQGQTLSCLRGRLKHENRETVLFPGEIPPDLPEPADWARDRFRFYDFAPRRLRAGEPGQHIRLDQALDFLLADRLR